MTSILSLRFVEIASKALTMLPDFRQRTKDRHRQLRLLMFCRKRMCKKCFSGSVVKYCAIFLPARQSQSKCKNWRTLVHVPGLGRMGRDGPLKIFPPPVHFSTSAPQSGNYNCRVFSLCLLIFGSPSRMSLMSRLC